MKKLTNKEIQLIKKYAKLTGLPAALVTTTYETGDAKQRKTDRGLMQESIDAILAFRNKKEVSN